MSGTHQAVLLQDEHARRLVERTGSEPAAVAAPRDRVNLGRVRGELAALAVVSETFLHLLIIP